MHRTPQKELLHILSVIYGVVLSKSFFLNNIDNLLIIKNCLGYSQKLPLNKENILKIPILFKKDLMKYNALC